MAVGHITCSHLGGTDCLSGPVCKAVMGPFLQHLEAKGYMLRPDVQGN